MTFFSSDQDYFRPAFVFPGQGSQYIGMGQDLHNAFQSAKDVFQEVDETLKQNLSDLMFSGDETDLKLTENTQPALMAVSMAVVRVLEKEFGFTLKDHASFVAGHSLGEYAALCATGVYDLSATARLLQERGRAMQRAVPLGAGGMAALIGASMTEVEDLTKRVKEKHKNTSLICEVANDNAPGQIVISGHLEAIDTAIKIAKEMGIKRAIPLPVSAPFHSSLMESAAVEMKTALCKETIQCLPNIPLISNVTATPINEESQIEPRLIEQITGRVRWVDSINYILEHETTHIIELGSGKVLSGLMKRIQKNIPSLSLEKPKDIEDFCTEITKK